MRAYTLIQAYFAKNLGDDMFVQALVRRYPREHFFIMETRKQLGDLAYEKNVHTLTMPIRLYFKVRSLLMRTKEKTDNSVSKKARAVIRIGGSIFIENNNWKEYIKPVNNKNTYILGANFGPYTSKEFFLYCTQQIGKTKDCCLRDKWSYNLLSEHLSNVRLAPDILFNYSYLPDDKGGNSIGISVIDFSNRDNICCEKANYIKGVLKICRYYIEKNRNVVLFGFCKSEGDEKAVDEIIDALGKTPRVKKSIYSGNILNYLQELNKCEKIYATRFHSMIIGWIMGKDVVPIIYSKKQINVITDIGFCGLQWDVLHHQEFPLASLETCNGKLDNDTIAKLRQRADEQFKKLDEFYNN